MSIYISKVENGERLEIYHLAKDEWELPSLFKEFEVWLNTHSSELAQGNWIADIGFSPRQEACGGGPIITKEIMSICLSKGIEIFLSEYGE